MAKPQARRLVLSPSARQDIRDILLWSFDKFGAAAAGRYRALLIQALCDIETNPIRLGSQPRTKLAKGARTYPLAFSRSSVESKQVKAPRHFILYRPGLTGLVVARILHDSRDLSRHVPTDYSAE